MDLQEASYPSTGVTLNGEVSAPPQEPVPAAPAPAAPAPAAPPPAASEALASTPATSLQCDECSAPVAEEQRYCVVCGAHRRHVSDPAARYLSQVSARSRSTRAAATARRTPRRSSRLSGIGVAVVLALIPVGAAVGVLAGRSSNNEDASLIRALSREQAADRTAVASGSSGATVSASTTGTGSKAGGSSSKSKKSGNAGKGTGTDKGKGGKSSASSTKATSISTAPPSAAAKATGSKVTKQVQSSTGKSYVNGQSGLPSTVVVP